jgi:hypothetical protein
VARAQFTTDPDDHTHTRTLTWVSFFFFLHFILNT